MAIEEVRSGPAPDHTDVSVGGSMIRAACWLALAVGEGAIFTKEQLRTEFPGVSQIDRRVREFRKFGWQIDEYRNGSGLEPKQQRLVRIGVPVWDKRARKEAGVSSVSGRVREEVLFRDGHACVRCGVSAGEYFDDLPKVKARLSAAHVYPGSFGGRSSVDDLVAACQRCNEAVQQDTHNYLDETQVYSRIERLPKKDKLVLLQRITTNRRHATSVDSRWREFNQLPGTSRESIRQKLEALLGRSS